jgi:very-short-patch-repair endonuclease
MVNLTQQIEALGGLAATHELYERGATRGRLSWAVHSGRILRVRQGWYCLPDLDERIVRAARVGGRLACVSAAEYAGFWMRGRHHLHVSVPDHDARLRSELDAHKRLRDSTATTVVHWHAVSGDQRLVQTVPESLVDLASCVGAEQAVSAADGALRTGMVNTADWARCVARAPARLRPLLCGADGRTESITESAFRFRVRRLGLDPAPQIAIPNVGRVDFVFGERLVVELDGRAYHSDPEAFERDRSRDARLSERGFRVLRFSYSQVFERWGEVRGSVLAALSRNDHRAV